MTLWRDCVCGQVFWQKPEPKGGGVAVGVAGWGQELSASVRNIRGDPGELSPAGRQQIAPTRQTTKY